MCFKREMSCLTSILKKITSDKHRSKKHAETHRHHLEVRSAVILSFTL